MKKVKQYLITFPEYYFLALAILVGYTPPFTFNPIFIGLAFIIFLQIYSKNRISGLILGSVFIFLNLYMLGALFSEFNEFSKYNTSAQQLLSIGLLLWGLTMFFSGVMIYKYTRTENLRIRPSRP